MMVLCGVGGNWVVRSFWNNECMVNGMLTFWLWLAEVYIVVEMRQGTKGRLSDYSDVAALNFFRSYWKKCCTVLQIVYT